MTDQCMYLSHLDMISHFILETLNHMIKVGYLRVRVSFRGPLASLPVIVSNVVEFIYLPSNLIYFHIMMLLPAILKSDIKYFLILFYLYLELFL